MLWDLNEGKHLYSLEAGDVVNALVFSPNRYWLCAATASCVKIFDLESKYVDVNPTMLPFLTSSFPDRLLTSSSPHTLMSVTRPGNQSVCPSPGRPMARLFSLGSLITSSVSGLSPHKTLYVCTRGRLTRAVSYLLYLQIPKKLAKKPPLSELGSRCWTDIPHIRTSYGARRLPLRPQACSR